MKISKEIIKEFYQEGTQFCLDCIIANTSIILSFAMRYELSVDLEEIYTRFAWFTFSTIFITPISLRLFWSPWLYSPHFLLLNLIRLMKVSLIVAIIITSIVFITRSPMSRAVLILLTFFNFVLFAFFRGPWANPKLSTNPPLFPSKSNSLIYSFYSKIFRSETTKQLVINITGSIIAFLIIYHLLRYR